MAANTSREENAVIDSARSIGSTVEALLDIVDSLDSKITRLEAENEWLKKENEQLQDELDSTK